MIDMFEFLKELKKRDLLSGAIIGSTKNEIDIGEGINEEIKTKGLENLSDYEAGIAVDCFAELYNYYFTKGQEYLVKAKVLSEDVRRASFFFNKAYRNFKDSGRNMSYLLNLSIAAGDKNQINHWRHKKNESKLFRESAKVYENMASYIRDIKNLMKHGDYIKAKELNGELNDSISEANSIERMLSFKPDTFDPLY